MAPEIARCDPKLKNKRNSYQYQGQDADCFAFGVIMLVVKTSSYPWEMPDIVGGDERNKNYVYLAKEGGVKAHRFWN